MKSFSLIETIISIFVFSILLLLIGGLVLILYSTHSYQWQQALAVSEAKRGLEIMVKEIREAREAENGAYPIELAGEKEFVFYSDIDNDGKTERVRYFLGKIEEKILTKECETSLQGGSCYLSFSNFFSGKLLEAKITVSLQGDFGSPNEYADLFVDGQKIATLCTQECHDCPNVWEGTQVFDVSSLATDNSLSLNFLASKRVDPFCPFSMKAKVDLYLKYEIQSTELKKGVIKPKGIPPTYSLSEEKIYVITQYVRNDPPIFEYYDEKGEKIENLTTQLKNIKLVKVFLVVNVDVTKPFQQQLESFIYLRNLKQ